MESGQASPRLHPCFLGVPWSIFLVVAGEYLMRHVLPGTLQMASEVLSPSLCSSWTMRILCFSSFLRRDELDIAQLWTLLWGECSALSTKNEKQIKQSKTKHPERQLPNISSSGAFCYSKSTVPVLNPHITETKSMCTKTIIMCFNSK